MQNKLFPVGEPQGMNSMCLVGKYKHFIKK